MFLVGDPYKPSFAPVTGRGDNPMYNVYIKFLTIYNDSKVDYRNIFSDGGKKSTHQHFPKDSGIVPFRLFLRDRDFLI